jgi:D-arabinose 1-dehydrogenase-like Zn-dependent alcohol dehydrogenase
VVDALLQYIEQRSGRHCERQRQVGVTHNGGSARAIRIPNFWHTALSKTVHVYIVL